jgi:hypothetical protein
MSNPEAKVAPVIEKQIAEKKDISISSEHAKKLAKDAHERDTLKTKITATEHRKALAKAIEKHHGLNVMGPPSTPPSPEQVGPPAPDTLDDEDKKTLAGLQKELEEDAPTDKKPDTDAPETTDYMGAIVKRGKELWKDTKSFMTSMTSAKDWEERINKGIDGGFKLLTRVGNWLKEDVGPKFAPLFKLFGMELPSFMRPPHEDILNFQETLKQMNEAKKMNITLKLGNEAKDLENLTQLSEKEKMWREKTGKSTEDFYELIATAARTNKKRDALTTKELLNEADLVVKKLLPAPAAAPATPVAPTTAPAPAPAAAAPSAPATTPPIPPAAR